MAESNEAESRYLNLAIEEVFHLNHGTLVERVHTPFGRTYDDLPRWRKESLSRVDFENRVVEGLQVTILGNRAGLGFLADQIYAIASDLDDHTHIPDAPGSEFHTGPEILVLGTPAPWDPADL
jgi:hypothetical protein